MIYRFLAAHTLPRLRRSPYWRFFWRGAALIPISILGSPPGSTFKARYGATWRHMLASFVPGPAVLGAHACS